MPVSIHADLDLVVDGVEGRLVDDGSALVLQTDQPIAMLRALSSATPGLPAALPEPLLRTLGPVHLDGPHGRIATLGSTDAGLGSIAVRDVRVRPLHLLPPALAAVVRWGAVVATALVALRAARRPRP